MTYIRRPSPCILDNMYKHIVIGNIQVYRNKEKDKYYTWDGLHGEIEVFNKRGKHLMVLDCNGKKIKDAVKGRSIDV